MFSKSELRVHQTEQKQKPIGDGELLIDALKGNEYISNDTFEEFLKRQGKKGKKHYFMKNAVNKSEAMR